MLEGLAWRLAPLALLKQKNSNAFSGDETDFAAFGRNRNGIKVSTVSTKTSKSSLWQTTNEKDAKTE